MLGEFCCAMRDMWQRGTSLVYHDTHIHGVIIQIDGHLTFPGNIAAIWRGLVPWQKNCHCPTEALMWESLQDGWMLVKTVLVLTTQRYWLCEWIMMTSGGEMSATPTVRVKSSSHNATEFEKSSPWITKIHWDESLRMICERLSTCALVV